MVIACSRPAETKEHIPFHYYDAIRRVRDLQWREALHRGRSAAARDIAARWPRVDRRAAAGRTLADMGTRLAAVETHREEIRAIAGRHRALSVSVFGSVARGDDGPDSDIDFLVEFEPGASLLDLMRIQDDLEDLLGGHIDVVSAGGPKDRDEHIRREAVLV